MRYLRDTVQYPVITSSGAIAAAGRSMPRGESESIQSIAPEYRPGGQPLKLLKSSINNSSNNSSFILGMIWLLPGFGTRREINLDGEYGKKAKLVDRWKLEGEYRDHYKS